MVRVQEDMLSAQYTTKVPAGSWDVQEKPVGSRELVGIIENHTWCWCIHIYISIIYVYKHLHIRIHVHVGLFGWAVNWMWHFAQVVQMLCFRSFIPVIWIPLPQKLHPWKLTWHWKIPIFTRKYIFIHGGFSSDRHLSFRGGGWGVPSIWLFSHATSWWFRTPKHQLRLVV